MIRKTSSDLRCSVCGKPAEKTYKNFPLCSDCYETETEQLDKINFSEEKPSDK